MLSAKLAALCLCPALVATPAVIATHPKARHAVAHLLHRAADRLETPNRASPTQLASAQCVAGAIAGGLGDGLAAPLSSFAAGSTLGIPVLSVPAGDVGSDVPGLTAFNAGGDSGVVAVGGGGFGGSGGGSGGGGGYSIPSMTPTPVAGVTEPQSWALLITGFGATGVMLRGRRVAA